MEIAADCVLAAIPMLSLQNTTTILCPDPQPNWYKDPEHVT